MAKKKTYEPFDDLLKDTGMTFKAIAQKAGMKDYTLYRFRMKPSKMDSVDIINIADATGIDERELSSMTLFFARKVDKIQHVKVG